MKRWLFVFILLLPLASAQEYFYYNSLEIEGSLQNPISIVQDGPNPKVSSLTANLTWFPTDDDHQTVLELTTDPKAAHIGDTLIFEESYPKIGNHIYTINYRVLTDVRSVQVTKKIPFPLTNVDPSLATYVQAKEVIDINDDIRQLASDLAGNQDDLFFVVAALADWTTQHIEYDLSTQNVEASQPSSWVLENRQGVCDELTNLFISMCRSLGIPARFISGLSYTNSQLFQNNWGAHGWAEVYFPGFGWVPFDVTYGQLGWVDATHLKFAVTDDSGKYASSYSWVGRDVDVQPLGMELDAQVTKTGRTIDPLLDIGVALLEREIGPGSYNVVMATVSNPTNHYVAEEIILGPTEGLEIIDPDRKVIALAPGQKQNVYWRVRVTGRIESGYRYTFPTVVFSQRNESGSDSFYVSEGSRVTTENWARQFIEGLSQGVSKPYSHAITFECTSRFENPRPGETFVVECLLKNNADRSFEAVDVCYKSCQEIDIAPRAQETLLFELSFDQEALHAASFSLTHELVQKNSFVQVEVSSVPDITIEHIQVPDSIDFSQTGTLHFELLAQNHPQNTQVNIRGSGIDKTWTFDLIDGRKVFDISVPGNVLFDQQNVYAIEVTYADDRGESYVLSEDIHIRQGRVEWYERISLFFLKLIK